MTAIPDRAREGGLDWGQPTVLVAVVLTAWFVRMANLPDQSLWVDEGIVYARATLPWGNVVSNLLLVGNQTPLYYVLLRFWVLVAGTSEFALRFPSVCAATVTVLVVFAVGRSVLGWRTGVLGAALLALNPFHLWYAQEARMYALGMLASAIVLLTFVRALYRPGRGDWVLFSLASGLAYLVHYFTLTLAAAQFVLLMCSLRRLYPRLRRWALCQILAALPVGVWMMTALARRGTTRLGGAWIPQPSLLAPLYTILNFSLGYEKDPSLLIAIGWALYAMGFGLAFWSRARIRWRDILLVWMAVPVTVTYLVSLRRPYYVDRYLAVALPAFVIWIALGVAVLQRRWQYVLGGLLLVASAWGVCGTVSGARFQKEDWRSAVMQVREMSRSGDRLLVASPEDVPVGTYYLEGVIPLEVLARDGSQQPLDQAVADTARIWVLYRVPTLSNHFVAEAANSVSVEEIEERVPDWLLSPPGQLLDRWAFPGLYLALLDVSG